VRIGVNEELAKESGGKDKRERKGGVYMEIELTLRQIDQSEQAVEVERALIRGETIWVERIPRRRAEGGKAAGSQAKGSDRNATRRGTS